MPERRPAKKTAANKTAAAKRTRRVPASTHEVQAVQEKVDLSPAVTFKGEKYRIADRVGAMPAWEFAWYAAQGVDADSMEGLAAMYELIRDSIDPADWPRFRRAAIDKKASSSELLAVCGEVTALITGRPTMPPSDSSTGRSPTPDTSKASSSSPDTSPPPGMVSVDSLLGL